jgi:uncharacterized protein (DUF488 family)
MRKRTPRNELMPLVTTIGHSTHELEGFIHLLEAHEATCVIAVPPVPWRCHRSLIADALLVRGIRTEDIMSATQRADLLSMGMARAALAIRQSSQGRPSAQ